jgi:hypothetical protein
MDIKVLVDLAIEDNPHAPMLWLPSKHFEAFCTAIRQEPNVIGAVIYRNKTIRDGGSVSDIVTRKP